MRRKTVPIITILLVLGILATAAPIVRPPIQGEPFNNGDVLKLVQAGFDSVTIVVAIRASDPNFDTSAEALVALKEAGVSEEIIVAILSAAPSRSVPSPPNDEGAGLPQEIGVYALNDGAYVPLPIEPVEWRSGFFSSGETTIGSLTTTKLNARLPTLHSPLALLGNAEFLIVTAPGVSALEYPLIRARDKHDQREFRVAFQVLRGDLWVAKGGTGDEKVPFEMEPVAPRKFRLKLPPLGEGEYAFLPPTTGANKSTLSVAKMYTFRVLRFITPRPIPKN